MLIWFPGKLLRERWGSASNRIGLGANPEDGEEGGTAMFGLQVPTLIYRNLLAFPNKSL
jgi:hypothetical protein